MIDQNDFPEHAIENIDRLKYSLKYFLKYTIMYSSVMLMGIVFDQCQLLIVLFSILKCQKICILPVHNICANLSHLSECCESIDKLEQYMSCQVKNKSKQQLLRSPLWNYLQNNSLNSAGKI